MLKKFYKPILIASLLLVAVSCDQKPHQLEEEQRVSKEENRQTFTNNDLLISETLGNFIGQTLKNPNSGVQLNLESLIMGIRNGFAGVPAPLSEEEYQKIIMEKEEEDFERRAASNLDAANEFMNKNIGEAIILLEPGKLHYEILHKGKESPIVTETSIPSIHYKGILLDGTVFGTTEKTGPISISLERMIPGFKKGMVGMTEGEKRRLYIHPEMAYGMTGDLPPNSLLIFEVSVVDANTMDDSTDYEIQEDANTLLEESNSLQNEEQFSITPLEEEEILILDELYSINSMEEEEILVLEEQLSITPIEEEILVLEEQPSITPIEEEEFLVLEEQASITPIEEEEFLVLEEQPSITPIEEEEFLVLEEQPLLDNLLEGASCQVASGVSAIVQVIEEGIIDEAGASCQVASGVTSIVENIEEGIVDEIVSNNP